MTTARSAAVRRAGAGRAEAARVRRLPDDVPAEQRDALLPVHCGGVSQREMAEVTGLPLGTVNSRVRLALARVREAVEATPAAPP
jgi:RNA polymerase sigma-70 factor (ECF subfamily)